MLLVTWRHYPGMVGLVSPGCAGVLRFMFRSTEPTTSPNRLGIDCPTADTKGRNAISTNFQIWPLVLLRTGMVDGGLSLSGVLLRHALRLMEHPPEIRPHHLNTMDPFYKFPLATTSNPCNELFFCFPPFFTAFFFRVLVFLFLLIDTAVPKYI